MHAAVKVTGTDENISREVATGSNGNYEALNLKPGFYKVTVDHPGFEQATVENLLLQARQTSRVDVTLKVGSVHEVVTVESQGGVIASETDTISSTYGTDKIVTLPTNSQSFDQHEPLRIADYAAGRSVGRPGRGRWQRNLPFNPRRAAQPV